jgi:hypothetical protein
MATRKTDEQDKLPKSQANTQKTLDAQAKADPATAADKVKPLNEKQAAKQAEQQETATAEAIEARTLIDEQIGAIGPEPSANPEDNQPEPEENPTNSKPVNVPDDEQRSDDEQAALDKQAREALVIDPPTAALPPSQRGTTKE